MDNYKRYRRTVTARGGPFTSLQLPVTIGGEKFKAVIDVGLPTSLISTAVWQKVNSPLFPMSDDDITKRVNRRTNLQLMGYTHFKLHVEGIVLDLEDALVYDFEEPEVFLNISAVAALGLIIDFQEGTFALRTEDGMRCDWKEDSVLLHDSKLGNVSREKKTLVPTYPTSTYPTSTYPTSSYYESSGTLNNHRQYGDPEPANVNSANYGMIPTYMGSNNMRYRPMPPPMHLSPMDQIYLGYNQFPPNNVMRKNVTNNLKNFYLKPYQRNDRYSTIVVVNTDQQAGEPGNKNNPSKKEDDKLGNKGGTPANQKMDVNAQQKGNLLHIKAKSILQVNSGADSENAKTRTPNNSKKRRLQRKRNAGSIAGASQAQPLNSEKTMQASGKKFQCANCHSEDHTIAKCKKPISLKCVYCGQAGHSRTQCPTVIKTIKPILGASSEVSPASGIPSTVTSGTPSSVTSKTPSTVTSGTPSTLTSKTPSTLTSKTPNTLTSKTPSTLTSKTTSTLTSKKPSTLTSKTPSTLTSKIPSTLTSETPNTETSGTPSSVTSGTTSTEKNVVQGATIVKRPAGTPGKVLVKKQKVVEGPETQQGPESQSNQSSKPVVRKVIRKVVRRVVGTKQPVTTNNQVAEGNTLAGAKGVVVVKKSVQNNSQVLEGSTPSVNKISQNADVNQMKPKAMSSTQAVAVNSQANTGNVNSKNTQDKVVSAPNAPDPLMDLDDNTFKKPEGDHAFRVPVNRVVTKKTIKLNMLKREPSSSTAADNTAKEAAAQDARDTCSATENTECRESSQ